MRDFIYGLVVIYVTLSNCFATNFSDLTESEKLEMQASLKSEQERIKASELLTSKPSTQNQQKTTDSNDEVFKILTKEPSPNYKNGRLHIFKDGNGNTLLSNVAPSIATAAKNKSSPQISDLVAGELENESYHYVKTEDIVPIKKRVKAPAKDLYKLNMCKLNDAYVPCYKYAKTIPAKTYYEDSSKSVRVNPQIILDDAKKGSPSP